MDYSHSCTEEISVFTTLRFYNCCIGNREVLDPIFEYGGETMDSLERYRSEISSRALARMNRAINDTWIHTVRGRTLTGTTIRTEKSSVTKNILIEPWFEHPVSQRYSTVRRGLYN